MSTEAPDILLAYYLKALKLPTFQREYQKLARLCSTESIDHVGYLFRLAEREMAERDRPPDQGSQIPRRQKPRQLRLYRHSKAQ